LVNFFIHAMLRTRFLTNRRRESEIICSYKNGREKLSKNHCSRVVHPQGTWESCNLKPPVQIKALHTIVLDGI